MSVFKACDIRGRYGSELTPAFAASLGRAVGAELAGQAVVVGGDVRPSTVALKAALCEGLVRSGCRVMELGIVPTPAFYFALRALGARGGVMVTGSHNPPGDNGFKISLGPWPITEEALAGLARRIADANFVEGLGTHKRVDIIDRYEEDLLGRFSPLPRPLKAVVDAGNGCYSQIAPRVLRALGCDVVELFCEPDGRFPNRAPNPAVAANLTRLCETVVAARADLGVAYDGDGDRVIFVDEQGRVVESDRTIVLFARHLLRRGPGEVIHDIKCSSVVPEAVRQAGGTPVMEKSGHAFIKTTLLRRGAILGGEISGHFFFGELGGDDGLYATLLMLHVIAEVGCGPAPAAVQGLAALVDTAPRYPVTPDIRLPCPIRDAEAIVQELIAAFADAPGCEVSTLDGVRIAWPDGWALIRPSVTEPLITLRFEAHTPERLAEIQRVVVASSTGLARRT